MSLQAVRLAFRRLFRKDEAERDLADEVGHLVEMTVDELTRQGLSRQAAERAARLQLGNPEVIKETARDAGWESIIETIWRDVRYAVHGLRRNFALTLAATLTLTLGIGATTAMFSVINGVMLRPLPYHDWRRLALLRTDDVRRGLHNEATAYLTITDWQRDNQAFDDIAFFTTERTTISAPEGRQRTRIGLVSPNLFSVLRTWPIHGRWLTDEDAHPSAGGRHQHHTVAATIQRRSRNHWPSAAAGRMARQNFTAGPDHRRRHARRFLLPRSGDTHLDTSNDLTGGGHARAPNASSPRRGAGLPLDD